MRGREAPWPPLHRLAPWAVLALVAATVLVRGVELGRSLAAGEGVPMTARGERQWFGWSSRHPEVIAALEGSAPQLPPGASVRLLVSPEVDLAWAAQRAWYYLPLQTVAGVHHPGDPDIPAAVPDEFLLDFSAGASAASP